MKMEDGYRRPDDGKGGLGEGFEHGKIDLPKGAIHYLDGLSPSQIDEEFDEKIKNQDESLKEKIEKFYEEAKEIVQKSMIEKGKTYETHKAETGDSRNGEISENRNKELTEEEKAKIKEETGLVPEILPEMKRTIHYSMPNGNFKEVTYFVGKYIAKMDQILYNCRG